MNPHKAGAAALAAALLLLAQPFPRAYATVQRRPAETRRSAAVFVVTKGGTDGDAQVEPVAVINGRGALEEPPSGTSGEGELSTFLAERYKTGTKYQLIFGGADAGALTIRAAAAAECAPNAASAEMSPALKLGGNVTALAAEGSHAPRAQVSRRAPTAEERAAAFAILKRYLVSKRVSASAVERGTKTLNLTATDLDGDGREELIGSYVVKIAPRVRDTLFLVAAPQGKGFRTALAKYSRVNAKELMDPSQIDSIGEGGLGTELYVEQLDVDGDGVGEFFTASVSFEGTTYRAYKLTRGAWRAVYEHYGYRCAY
jgi:hypothetical protein